MAMANATCTCKKCGKTFEVSKKCYNRSDANNFEQYAKDAYDLCPDCRREIEKEKSELSILETESLFGLSKLNGTEKQISWARNIRNKLIKSMQYARVKDFVFDWIKTKTEADWWIEQRYYYAASELLDKNYDEILAFADRKKDMQ